MYDYIFNDFRIEKEKNRPDFKTDLKNTDKRVKILLYIYVGIMAICLILIPFAQFLYQPLFFVSFLLMIMDVLAFYVIINKKSMANIYKSSRIKENRLWTKSFLEKYKINNPEKLEKAKTHYTKKLEQKNEEIKKNDSREISIIMISSIISYALGFFSDVYNSSKEELVLKITWLFSILFIVFIIILIYWAFKKFFNKQNIDYAYDLQSLINAIEDIIDFDVDVEIPNAEPILNEIIKEKRKILFKKITQKSQTK